MAVPEPSTAAVPAPAAMVADGVRTQLAPCSRVLAVTGIGVDVRQRTPPRQRQALAYRARGGARFGLNRRGFRAQASMRARTCSTAWAMGMRTCSVVSRLRRVTWPSFSES